MTILNHHDVKLVRLGSREFAFCIWCGRPRQESHHEPPRSHGNKTNTYSMCSVCHGLRTTNRLHFKAENGRLYGFETVKPMKIDKLMERIPGIKGWVDMDIRIDRFKEKWEESS